MTIAHTRMNWLLGLGGLVLAIMLAGCGGGGKLPAGPPVSVALSASGAGQIGGDFSCRGVCTASWDAGANVSLSATPDAGYRFAGWTGLCSGTGGCSFTVPASGSPSVGAVFVSLISAPPTPKVLYLDAVSGPTSGGENGQGAYLSIFGKNFGAAGAMGTTTKVYVGGVEVANYRSLGDSVVAGKLGIQRLTVQVGALGGGAQGAALPVKVVVNGLESNTDQTFTPNPGRMLFVSLSGNDATAVAGDITRPWRRLQAASEYSGVMAAVQPGDHVVIRGGEWNDTSGFDGNAWLRFQTRKGSAPTGAWGTGWIHITAYPGAAGSNAPEDVHYTTPDGKGGGIWGPGEAHTGEGGEYISVSNLRMEVSAGANSDAAPINLQTTGGRWRVVNNLLGPWPSNLVKAVHGTNARAGAISGHGQDVFIHGNRIRGIHCDPAILENHGVYADTTAFNWDVGYNWIHDITGGSSVQFFDNDGELGVARLPGGGTWEGFTGIRVHHNWLEHSAKYGVNVGDPGSISVSRGRVEMRVWNNVVIGTAQVPMRVASSAAQMDITFAHNTLYDASTAGERAYFGNYLQGNAPRVVRVYNNLLAFGPRTFRTNRWFLDIVGNQSSGWDFRNNLYWDNGYGRPENLLDATRLSGDPRFLDAAGGNLGLNLASPGFDGARQAVPFAITDDLTAVIARPQGGGSDIGALERVP